MASRRSESTAAVVVVVGPPAVWPVVAGGGTVIPRAVARSAASEWVGEPHLRRQPDRALDRRPGRGQRLPQHVDRLAVDAGDGDDHDRYLRQLVAEDLGQRLVGVVLSQPHRLAQPAVVLPGAVDVALDPVEVVVERVDGDPVDHRGAHDDAHPQGQEHGDEGHHVVAEVDQELARSIKTLPASSPGG